MSVSWRIPADVVVDMASTTVWCGAQPGTAVGVALSESGRAAAVLDSGVAPSKSMLYSSG
ncbi:hypothetical protein [Nocardia callitridis]|uniref:hypothetical protein n=1 Tax=Nocardia callitridis TaxID=648753 RepID=UPI0031EC9979